MWIDLENKPEIGVRRAPRIGFELPVRIKHGLNRSTAMLKDLTHHGARVAGLGQLAVGEAITLFLPGLAPKLAFVVWTDPAASGFEFDCPLPGQDFDALVADYALGQAPASAPFPFSLLRRAVC